MAGRYLVIFHLGPVQDFIATARRCRDLWFGSWLLSELAKAAAREIVNQHGGDMSCLIFPAPNRQADLDSQEFCAPNRVVALVTGPPEDLGEKVREAVLRRLREVRDKAFQKVKGQIHRDTANRQVEEMLEFYWAACPMEGDFRTARAVAESLLAARKTTRDFAPAPWAAEVPKCSLCGRRESVIPEPVYDQKSEEELFREYGIRRGERLCGVGFLKRHGERAPGFFSTSHVAALPLLERLAEGDKSYVEEYIGVLKGLGLSPERLGKVPVEHPVFGCYDGHLLFEERLREFFEDDATLEEAKIALQDFLEKAFGGDNPLPYYALLIADGDRMGKVINAQGTPEEQRNLSQKLSEFALTAARIVRGHQGSLVYSGGDDVLAFVPLHRALDCARELAATFRQMLATFKVFEAGREISPTLSVGMVVAHHLAPMDEVLELARETEKHAKSVQGKDALAVTVSKRSGVDRTVAAPWGTLDRRLERFVALHRLEAIPDRAAYELRDLALKLDFLAEAARKEAVRILRRKEAERGVRPVATEVLSELEALLGEEGLSIAQLADELIVAREFAKAQDLAGMPIPGKDVT